MTENRISSTNSIHTVYSRHLLTFPAIPYMQKRPTKPIFATNSQLWFVFGIGKRPANNCHFVCVVHQMRLSVYVYVCKLFGLSTNMHLMEYTIKQPRLIHRRRWILSPWVTYLFMLWVFHHNKLSLSIYRLFSLYLSFSIVFLIDS